MMKRGRDGVLILSLLALMMMMISSRLPLAVSAFAYCTIQVCQNKDCRQRFEGSSGTDLVRTFQDLLPPSTYYCYYSSDDDKKTNPADAVAVVRVEPSGCLSQCGKGPNISVQVQQSSSPHSSSPPPPPVLVHGIRDVNIAAAELELSCGVSVHPTLLAAVKVLEKAEKGMFSCLFGFSTTSQKTTRVRTVCTNHSHTTVCCLALLSFCK